MAAPAYNGGGFAMPPAQPTEQMPMVPPQGGQAQGMGAPVYVEGDGQWMGQVSEQLVPKDCPPGLEYLTMIDQIMIKQKVEMLEAVAGVMGYGLETSNKYRIKNVMGQNIYKAVEDTDCCMRIVCGPSRPFDMIIKDNADREVLHLNRPLKCNSCLFPCCLQKLEVSAPPGNTIGFVKQKWTCIKPKFEITDGDGNVALVIKGPWCTYACGQSVEFKVMTPDEQHEVGRISKEWTGILKEAFTDSDNFGITFPMDLDVRCKATLIGAAFLIDYMFFEKKANNENDGVGMAS